jgi:hypothetical protein
MCHPEVPQLPVAPLDLYFGMVLICGIGGFKWRLSLLTIVNLWILLRSPKVMQGFSETFASVSNRRRRNATPLLFYVPQISVWNILPISQKLSIV